MDSQDYGEAPPNKYSAIKPSIENGTLTVKDLTLEDSGVYFCAVYVWVLRSVSLSLTSSKELWVHILGLEVPGVSLEVQVHQSPSEVIKKAGGDVQLVCTHEQSDYRVMLWYQQSPGDKALKLIGYGYVQFTNDSVEETFRKHFKLAGDLESNKIKNGSLYITDLKALEHTATYFCAAREAQHIKHPPALDKNLFTPLTSKKWA
ncbi:hypothetical protein L3Q82_008191 [Scortum barcoo]|uniref:Uncharacterized protein n=1 Tax=Scortum barcoo TaxID=214431 RepID=A0ACB8WH05_9TELE|nr:hypothetical protein L3Q82_008191 [Scortum barcoo]